MFSDSETNFENLKIDSELWLIYLIGENNFGD